MFVVILYAILDALPDAAAFGGLISLFVAEATIVTIGRAKIRGKILIGLGVFFILIVVMSVRSIVAEVEHRLHLKFIERQVAFYAAGIPLTLEQIQDHFETRDLNDIQDALWNMEVDGTIQTSKYDAIIAGDSNVSVRVRMYVVPSTGASPNGGH
jgi:hypothetical protein